MVKVCAAAVLVALIPKSAVACRLALALAVDVSSSVDRSEYYTQITGLAAALVAPEVEAAFFAGPQPVALAVYEWSGNASQRLVMDWALIHDPKDLVEVAEEVAGFRWPAEFGSTAIGSALRYGSHLMERAPSCWQYTIDVSGDGQSNDGLSPAQAYQSARFNDITVNGLVIGGAADAVDLLSYYRDHVLRGPGSFMMVAQTHEDFEAVMRRKLEREVRPKTVGVLVLD